MGARDDAMTTPLSLLWERENYGAEADDCFLRGQK